MVRQLEAEELIELIKKSARCQQTMEESRGFITKLNNVQSEELKWQGSTYSLTCVFDQQLIETPARGRLCSHVQCFSLENQIRMNQNQQRKWRCPICKQKCFEFVIDNYQKAIIAIIKAHNMPKDSISFDPLGHVQDDQLRELLRAHEHNPSQQDELDRTIQKIKNDELHQSFHKKHDVDVIEID